MIFRGFKRKSNQIFFKKQLPVLLENSHKNTSAEVKKVIVFLDDVSKKTEIKNSLSSLFNLSDNAIDWCVFLQKKSKSEDEEGVFTPKDFGWFGMINAPELKSILTKKYDLLINYSKVESLYSDLLILRSRTAFRVGFAHLDSRFYDLVIDCDAEDWELFNSELKKYLKILNKI